MKNFATATLLFAMFTACNNKPAAPLKTDLVVLTPRNKINVYTDESPVTARKNKKALLVKNDSNSVLVVANGDTAKNIAYATNAVAPKHNPAHAPVAPVIIKRTPVKDTVAIVQTQPQPQPANPNAKAVSNTVIVAPPAVNKPDTISSLPKPVIAEKNKGWNNATKGAVIGGVSGAIGGAIISKQKAKGAIIGGVIGAAGGYIFGKSKDDKKDTAAKGMYRFTQYK